MIDPLMLLIVLVCSFLLGSIPSGVIIGKLVFHTDIRRHGSGNIGTTNAMRTIGKGGGALVFLCDFGKGLLSGGIAYAVTLYGTSATGMFTAADCLSVALFGCAYGHIFSPWLGFHGGKGIAVSVGCLFFTYGPLGACIELGLFALLVVITRYVSIGSMAAALLCPLLGLFYFWGDWLAVVCCTVLGLTVFWAHRANIARLRAGNENKIGAHRERDDA